jgi:hypothetical protein
MKELKNGEVPRGPTRRDVIKTKQERKQRNLSTKNTQEEFVDLVWQNLENDPEPTPNKTQET